MQRSVTRRKQGSLQASLPVELKYSYFLYIISHLTLFTLFHRQQQNRDNLSFCAHECWPSAFLIFLQTSMYEKQHIHIGQPPFNPSHSALMACLLLTTSLDLKEDACLSRRHFLSVPQFFLSSPFALPCLPPLTHWSSLTEKVWNRLRVGPQNKEAWQRFKSVWSYSRMGLCLHRASRRGKPAGNNPQLKALCCLSPQSSN